MGSYALFFFLFFFQKIGERSEGSFFFRGHNSLAENREAFPAAAEIRGTTLLGFLSGVYFDNSQVQLGETSQPKVIGYVCHSIVQLSHTVSF